MVATRIRDTALKRVLSAMPLGSVVKIEGPSGDLTLHNNVKRTAVFLAGGIGITPFRSIVGRAAKEKLPHRIFLFYSNRRPEDAPFLDELQALQEENPNYTLIATMTEMPKSQRPWRGETGLIDQAMLSKHLKEAVSPIYYVAGPPEMVKGLHTVINETGVDDDDIPGGRILRLLISHIKEGKNHHENATCSRRKATIPVRHTGAPPACPSAHGAGRGHQQLQCGPGNGDPHTQ